MMTAPLDNKSPAESPFANLAAETDGVRMQVRDGLIVLRLSGDVGAAQIGRIASELDAICRVRAGTLAVIWADDAHVTEPGAQALHNVQQRYGAEGVRMRLFGGNPAVVGVLVDCGLVHDGPWNAGPCLLLGPSAERNAELWDGNRDTVRLR